MHVVLAGPGHQPGCTVIATYRLGDIGKDGTHALRIGPGGLGRLLSTTQLRRGDHFHRLGDFLRRLDGGDPVFQILK